MTIKAIVHEEDGGFWAEVPSLPGCVTEGDDLDELVSNLWEAIEGCTAARRDLDPSIGIATRLDSDLELLLSAAVAAA